VSKAVEGGERVALELSVVVPVYNEEANLHELHRRLDAVLAGLGVESEIVLVDDGSADRSWAIISELAAADPRVKGVRFSRNFGHQMAFTAGLDHASGRAVVIMDADLQDPPEVIADLFARYREGFDVVYAVRAKREGETAFKLLTATAFYRLLRAITGIAIPMDTGDFRLMGPKAVAAFRRLPERHRFTRGMVAWLGFRQTGVSYVRRPRAAGVSNYPFSKMARFAVDGITSFSQVPLRLALWLGGAVMLLAVVGGCVFAAGKVLGHPWWGAHVLAMVLLFVAGVQLVCIGLLGEYVGRALDQVKGRPLYLVQELAGDVRPAVER
jgi:polyisoprenyl-phosphate glycosyltransferase